MWPDTRWCVVDQQQFEVLDSGISLLKTLGGQRTLTHTMPHKGSVRNGLVTALEI
jgi:hypothetical protein